jgi:bifunctional DNase/RNase
MANPSQLHGLAGTCLLLALCTACGVTSGEPTEAVVQVAVDRIAIDDHGVPVVVLEEEDGPRWLPIWIGTAEARSIALEIEERTSPRPNSHDLARDMIRGLDASVERVVVTELRDGTYYAVLGMALGDRIVEIDARPSDAIAIALRDGAPIYVRSKLFEQNGSSESDQADAPRREI